MVLNVIGLIMAYSTTYYWSYADEGNVFVLFGRQLLWAVAGMALFVIASRFDYGRLRSWASTVVVPPSTPR